MALFQKGVSGNPGGKPKGVKNADRTNYLNLQLWFKRMWETLDDIDKPSERMTFQLQIADKLMAKVANIPTTPEESASNALERRNMIEALEEGPKTAPAQNPGGTDVLDPHP